LIQIGGGVAAPVQTGFSSATARRQTARRIADAILAETARAGFEAGLVFIAFSCGIFPFSRPRHLKTQ
jgi:hypothetical protein